MEKHCTTHCQHRFPGNELGLPQSDYDTWTPLSNFKLFWKDDLNVILSEQTNIYNIQRKGTSIAVTLREVQQFIGLQMFMSFVQLPAHRMYWSKETRYRPVADEMSINRCKLLHEHLNGSSNLEKDKAEIVGNKLFKIQTVLDHVRQNC